MSNLRLFLHILFMLGCYECMDAQTIKRFTLSSTGKLGNYISDAKDTIAVEYTFGQCPGCTVLNGGSFFLRQGFQQPLADMVKDTTGGGGNGGNSGGGGTGLPPCAPNDPAGNFNIDFNITNQITTCGTYYDFEYTGDLKPNMKFGWDFSPTGIPRYAYISDPKKIGFTSKGIKFIRLEAGVTCSKSITKTLNVTQDAFVAQAVSKGNILCNGQKTGEITLTAYGGTPPYKYQWSSGLSATTNHKNLGAGNYLFTVTDVNSCEFSSSVTIVEPKAALAVTAKVKDEACKDTKDGEINLTTTGGTAPYEFLWNDNAATPTRTNLVAGTYKVTITDDNGCTTSISADVKRFCDKTGNDFPNTFTPNDDGINDGWEFPGIDDFPKNTVEVFNRWGALVFSTSGYKSGQWKGTNEKGQPLPAGPYYYVVKLNDRDKTIISGAVTIIR
jgi:gliding motility-associated-like protein